VERVEEAPGVTVAVRITWTVDVRVVVARYEVSSAKANATSAKSNTMTCWKERILLSGSSML
jgi:hypothetical protein